MLDQPALFDFYNGGGVDIAFLGLGQVDSDGNVNVGRLGDRINGVGGFVNISQSAPRLVLCGLFSAGNQDVRVQDDRLHIVRDGPIAKFVRAVDQIDFYAPGAYRDGAEVKYVTERAVFELRADTMSPIFRVDYETGRLLDTLDRPSPRIYVLGSMTSGTYFFTNAMDVNARHAMLRADEIVKRVAHSEIPPTASGFRSEPAIRRALH